MRLCYKRKTGMEEEERKGEREGKKKVSPLKETNKLLFSQRSGVSILRDIYVSVCLFL